jgi:hypothetical protein
MVLNIFMHSWPGLMSPEIFFRYWVSVNERLLGGWSCYIGHVGREEPKEYLTSHLQYGDSCFLIKITRTGAVLMSGEKVGPYTQLEIKNA